jgi:hypothetical protein
MAAFFRGLLLFLFGALAGAAGILFLTPSFQVDIRRGDTAIKPLDLGTRVAQPTARPAVVTPAPTKTAAPTVVAVKPVAPAAPTAPAVSTTPAATEPALDFAAISRHLILWPTAVTVKTPTTVVVNVEGQKPQDLALDAGAVLQLTRVLPTGQLEVRAKGAKFEIKSSSTDFTAELGKRVSELVAKGTKFDSPYPAATASAPAPVSTAPAATTVAAAAPVVAAPKRPPTLAERIDVLYGRKPPEPEVTPAASAPTAAPAASTPAAPAASAAAPAAVAPAAPVVPPAAVVAPAPTPATPEAAKVEEKGKDLDRKMNQLFK